MTLTQPSDHLAHEALESLFLAEASVRRRLAADLEREGLSSSGFSVLMVLSASGGELELRALRARLRTSKANATDGVTTLEKRGMVQRFRLPHDRRAAAAGRAQAGGHGPDDRRLLSRWSASVCMTAQGRKLVDRLAPEHTQRVTDAFAMLDAAEKKQLADICRKLPAEGTPA